MALLQLAVALACPEALAVFSPLADLFGSRPAFKSNDTQAFRICSAHSGNGHSLVECRKPSTVLARQGEQPKIRKLPRAVNPLGLEEVPVA